MLPNVHTSADPLRFEPWPKIPRLHRDVTITEKIDGSNAQILISQDGDFSSPYNVDPRASRPSDGGDGLIVLAGSRTRWLTHNADNYGFYDWVCENRSELVKLGPGRHFGEWWGSGINRNYGLTDRRFSLFNTHRWIPAGGWPELPDSNRDARGAFEAWQRPDGEYETKEGPNCVHVVPVIWRGSFDQFDVRSCTEMLRSHGSFAAPGFKNPEGIVVWHEAAQQAFKVLLENDNLPKGLITV